jgi:hypothetical protein
VRKENEQAHLRRLYFDGYLLASLGYVEGRRNLLHKESPPEIYKVDLAESDGLNEAWSRHERMARGRWLGMQDRDLLAPKPSPDARLNLWQGKLITVTSRCVPPTVSATFGWHVTSKEAEKMVAPSIVMEKFVPVVPTMSAVFSGIVCPLHVSMSILQASTLPRTWHPFRRLVREHRFQVT